MRLTPHMRSRVLTGSLITALVLAISAPAAQAVIVPVDPGKALSAGKSIVGSGQNLPSIDTSATYDVGPGPAPQIDSYYTSGAAARDQQEVAAAALRWTRGWVKEICGSTKPADVRRCKAAAVFDIDDTLVTWFPVLSSNSPAFGYDSARADAAMAACTTPVIEGTKRLYLTLQRMGVTPILITGRPDTQRDITVACLNSLGLAGWQTLIMRAAGDDRPASVYKSQARKGLERQGWRIGPSTGDQISDMALGHLGHGFLIPNPMYFIP